MTRSNPINRSSRVPVLRSAGREAPPKGAARFYSGDNFRGKVIGHLENNRVIISINNKTLLAKTQLPVSKGKIYHFTVESVQPDVVLKVLDTVSVRSSMPLQLRDANRSLREQVYRILQEIRMSPQIKGLGNDPSKHAKMLELILSRLVYKGPQRGGAQWVKRCLLASGLFWENKIVRAGVRKTERQIRELASCDLKGSLFSLLQTIQKKDGGTSDMDHLQARINKAILLIEKEQLQILSSLKGAWGWLWCIAGSEEHGLKGGELWGRKGEENDGYQLSLRLDFTRLGKVEVRLLLTNNFTDIQIFAEDDKKRRRIRNSLSLLRKAINGIGLTVREMSCECYSPHPDKFSRDTTNDPGKIHLVM
jgi:hypothetical protein